LPVHSIPLRLDLFSFQLLLKQKGGKQPKAVEVAIPNSDKMLSTNLAHQAQQQEEMLEMKRRVLRYDERDRQLDEEEKKRGEFDNSVYFISRYFNLPKA
jgi:hypothetical protein